MLYSELIDCSNTATTHAGMLLSSVTFCMKLFMPCANSGVHLPRSATSTLHCPEWSRKTQNETHIANKNDQEKSRNAVKKMLNCFLWTCKSIDRPWPILTPLNHTCFLMNRQSKKSNSPIKQKLKAHWLELIYYSLVDSSTVAGISSGFPFFSVGVI